MESVLGNFVATSIDNSPKDSTGSTIPQMQASKITTIATVVIWICIWGRILPLHFQLPTRSDSSGRKVESQCREVSLPRKLSSTAFLPFLPRYDRISKNTSALFEQIHWLIRIYKFNTGHTVRKTLVPFTMFHCNKSTITRLMWIWYNDIVMAVNTAFTASYISVHIFCTITISLYITNSY